jgi:hypothetical protein
MKRHYPQPIKPVRAINVTNNLGNDTSADHDVVPHGRRSDGDATSDPDRLLGVGVQGRRR